MDNNQTGGQKESKKGFSGIQVFGIVIGAIFLTICATVSIGWFYLFPKPFEPVVLTAGEQKVLENKLDKLEEDQRSPRKEFAADGRLIPEKYNDDVASRSVVFTEREINAMIATNTDLADKVAVDLSDNLISAKMRVPLDPDMPFFGGKTLRVKTGVEMAYREGRPVVTVKGISLMGVSLPNAWIGGIKNVDLVKEFGDESGFWKAFADGVDSVLVEEGRLKVTLKE